jgi:hypothetical protein
VGLQTDGIRDHPDAERFSSRLIMDLPFLPKTSIVERKRRAQAGGKAERNQYHSTSRYSAAATIPFLADQLVPVGDDG